MIETTEIKEFFDLTTEDIFKSKNLQGLEVQKDHLLFQMDGQIYKLHFDDVGPLNGLLIRLLSKVEVLVDTSTVFEAEPNINETGGN